MFYVFLCVFRFFVIFHSLFCVAFQCLCMCSMKCVFFRDFPDCLSVFSFFELLFMKFLHYSLICSCFCVVVGCCVIVFVFFCDVVVVVV